MLDSILASITANFSESKGKPGWSLEQRDPQVIQQWLPIWGWFHQHYFRVQTSGWHHIPADRSVLFVGSHNGGLAAPDMVMMMYDWFHRFGVERPVYGLMHPIAWQVFAPLTQLAAQLGAVVAHPKLAIAALQSGASVLVYPGGPRDVFRPHDLRHQIYFGGNQAFIKLALQQNVPIIPVVSHGAHDTLMVLADLYPQLRQLHESGLPWLFGIDPQTFPIYLGLPWGLAIGPLPNLPLPVTIHTRIGAPILFPRYGVAASRDRAYVETCYQHTCSIMQQELDQLVKDAAEQTQ